MPDRVDAPGLAPIHATSEPRPAISEPSRFRTNPFFSSTRTAAPPNPHEWISRADAEMRIRQAILDFGTPNHIRESRMCVYMHQSSWTQTVWNPGKDPLGCVSLAALQGRVLRYAGGKLPVEQVDHQGR